MQMNPVASPFKTRYLPTGRDVQGFRGRLGGMGGFFDFLLPDTPQMSVDPAASVSDVGQTLMDSLPSINSVTGLLNQVADYNLKQAQIDAQVKIAEAQAQAQTVKKTTGVSLPNMFTSTGAAPQNQTMMMLGIGAVALGGIFMLTRKGR